jgi:hypothetical protein
MSGILDKINKLKNSRQNNNNFGGQTRGIFHNWEDGENHIRLIGEFLEVKTHFACPNPKRGDRGLCQQEAFDTRNSNSIPKVINCPDWDVEKEEETSKKKCPICKLYQIAKQALKEDPTPKEKEYFERLLQATKARSSLKWNIFDRDNPNVTVVDEKGNEVQKKGVKIATIGMEAYNDIEGIFNQCGFDITDPEDGVDICVKRVHNGMRPEYSAQVQLSGRGLKVTPFDKEELGLVERLPDLKAICGKQTDPDNIMDALHGDYRELLEMNDTSISSKSKSKSVAADDDDDDDKTVDEETVFEDIDTDIDDDDEDDALLSPPKKK